jgi:hypothetical protein
MPDTDLPLSVFALFYLQLSKRRRRIFQYLWWFQKKYGPNVFPKMANIAKFAGISERAVQKFFAQLGKRNNKKFYLTIIPRFKKNGGKTTNQYILNNNFKMAIDWLDIHNKLNAPRKNTDAIFFSIQKEEKVHLPPPQKFTSLSVNSSLSEIQTTSPPVWINPLLKNVRGLDKEAQLYATRNASEYQIVEALEACRYQIQVRKRHIPNPSAYFTGVLKNKMRRIS